MNKTVSFEKKIEFPSMIGKVSAIALEKYLDFMDESNVEGYFLLSGKYKISEASRLEEDFSYKIPVEITLLEKIVDGSGKIEISNFTYEVENENTMVCHIELNIEGEEKLEEEYEEERECDGDDILEKEIEIPILEKEEEKSEEKEEISVDENSFLNPVEEEETYGTFLVYIVRESETLNSILEKYSTSLEEFEKYNDIKDITIGSKLIIPLANE